MRIVHILLSGRGSGLTSPSRTSHAGVNNFKKVEKRVRLILPIGSTRVRTRAGAVGEKASIDITASVRIYQINAEHRILPVSRRNSMGTRASRSKLGWSQAVDFGCWNVKRVRRRIRGSAKAAVCG
jgi:hypothetical protein